ncbi:Annexin A4 [Fusarium oxysporum f. sp. albedinis]|nr:Annexin A4 [Fusarium oxysporum f. sp. albedinis]
MESGGLDYRNKDKVEDKNSINLTWSETAGGQHTKQLIASPPRGVKYMYSQLRPRIKLKGAIRPSSAQLCTNPVELHN